MTNWIRQIIDIGTDNLDRRADRMKIRTLNATCILGIIVPALNLSAALISGFASLELILIETSTFAFFFVALYLNFKQKYYIASIAATFLVYITCILSFITTQGQIDHHWFLLVLAIYPFIVLYPKEWMNFAFSMLFSATFLYCLSVEFPNAKPIKPADVRTANNVIYWIITLMTFHQSAWLYYIHKSNVEDVTHAKEKAEENDRLKSAFLSNMSHEIRTPINSIIGFSDYLSREDLGEDQKKQYAAIINESCHQLLQVVNDILDISKIETNQMTINNTPTALVKLINALHSSFEILAKRKNLKFQLTHNLIGEETTVGVDKIKLRQILNNLLSNAIKYTNQGSVIFKVKKTKQHLLFAIKDTGSGIKKAQQEAIFDRFQQIENDMTAGTGLGLAISKGLAELMNGKIWVESEWQQGSTFYLNIPYQNIQNPETEEVKTSTLQLPSKNHFSKQKVLIAEDEIFNFKLLEVMLQQFGAEMIWVKNGQDAVNAVKEHSDFDLIFMDIKMPVMDGLEAIRLIKQTHPNIPIVAQSAFAFTDEKERCVKVGCDHYLTKPIPKQDLVDIFQKYAPISTNIEKTSVD